MTAISTGLEAARSVGRLNVKLLAGLAIIAVILAFSYLGPLFVDTSRSQVGAHTPNQSPSRENLLGTDTQGRDMLVTLMVGTPQTLKVGLMAGAVGLGLGIILGLMSGYRGGLVDAVIRISADVLLTVPGLAILIIITSMVRVISVEGTALVVASLSWMWPTRTIRSQVLTIRERGYIQVAKLSGMNPLEIIWAEILPNLLPYIAASFVAAVAAAILATIGLEVLGLGPVHTPTLGMMIYWAQFYHAVFREMWWWFAPPIVIIVLIFIGLFLMSTGLDEVSNPRLRKRT